MEQQTLPKEKNESTQNKFKESIQLFSQLETDFHDAVKKLLEDNPTATKIIVAGPGDNPHLKLSQLIWTNNDFVACLGFNSPWLFGQLFGKPIFWNRMLGRNCLAVD